MGNCIAIMKEDKLSEKANRFIFKYNSEWTKMLNLVRKARRESSDDILQQANAIIAPKIIEYGIDEDGDFGVWKELWYYIKEVTKPIDG